MSTEQPDSELFRLASLIGCEPESEERHRKQLLEYLEAHYTNKLKDAVGAMEHHSPCKCAYEHRNQLRAEILAKWEGSK